MKESNELYSDWDRSMASMPDVSEGRTMAVMILFIVWVFILPCLSPRLYMKWSRPMVVDCL